MSEEPHCFWTCTWPCWCWILHFWCCLQRTFWRATVPYHSLELRNYSIISITHTKLLWVLWPLPLKLKMVPPSVKSLLILQLLYSFLSDFLVQNWFTCDIFFSPEKFFCLSNICLNSIQKGRGSGHMTLFFWIYRNCCISNTKSFVFFRNNLQSLPQYFSEAELMHSS